MWCQTDLIISEKSYRSLFIFYFTFFCFYYLLILFTRLYIHTYIIHEERNPHLIVVYRWYCCEVIELKAISHLIFQNQLSWTQKVSLNQEVYGVCAWLSDSTNRCFFWTYHLIQRFTLTQRSNFNLLHAGICKRNYNSIIHWLHL